LRPGGLWLAWFGKLGRASDRAGARVGFVCVLFDWRGSGVGCVFLCPLAPSRQKAGTTVLPGHRSCDMQSTQRLGPWGWRRPDLYSGVVAVLQFPASSLLAKCGCGFDGHCRLAIGSGVKFGQAEACPTRRVRNAAGRRRWRGVRADNSRSSVPWMRSDCLLTVLAQGVYKRGAISCQLLAVSAW